MREKFIEKYVFIGESDRYAGQISGRQRKNEQGSTGIG